MTAITFDTIIKNGTIVSHRGADYGDIGIKDGKTVAIGSLNAQQAAKVIDATGLHVLPGVIDTQVHFREPGMEHKEDLESGTRSGVMGGVTALFEMPNTNPLTTTPEALQDKLDRADGRCWTNYAFYVGASPDNIAHLPMLERYPGVCGVKMFVGASTGSLLVDQEADMKAVMASGVRRMAIHSEDNDRLKERKHIADAATSAHAHPEWRDVESALKSTKRLVRLARETGRRIHVLHITTAEEMDFLAQHKDIASVEVLVNHLSLHAPDCYDRLGSKAQMNPPVREKRHQDALWAALKAGVVDIIGTDHAPHTLEEKAQPYPKSPSGMPGVQTLVPIMLDHMAKGRLTLMELHDLLCAAPARLFGLVGKGRIAVGYDADYTIVDLKHERVIEDSWIQSKTGWTPFAGQKVTGWPTHTIIGGAIVMQEDELIGRPRGTALRFNETFVPEG